MERTGGEGKGEVWGEEDWVDRVVDEDRGELEQMSV